MLFYQIGFIIVVAFCLFSFGEKIYCYSKKLRERSDSCYPVTEDEVAYDTMTGSPEVTEISNPRDDSENVDPEDDSNDDDTRDGNSRDDESGEHDSRDEYEARNRVLLIEILNKLDCQPQINADSNVTVAFQGENFFIQTNGIFLRIWDLNWLNTKEDEDDFAPLRDALNYANFTFGPTIVMHAPDEEGNIYISSRIDIILSPEIEDAEAYIHSILDSFFNLKHMMYREYTRLKGSSRYNPQPSSTGLTPFGFDPSSLTDPTSPRAN